MKFVETDGEDPTQLAGKAAADKLVEDKVKALEEKLDKGVAAAEKLVEGKVKALEEKLDKGVAAAEKFIEDKTKPLGKNVGKGVAALEKLVDGKVKGLEEKTDKGVAAGEKFVEGEVKALKEKAHKALGIDKKTKGAATEPDLPIFDEIAVTSSGDKAPGGIVGQVAGAIASFLGKNLQLHVASGDALDVRNFAVQERLSSLFQVSLIAVSDNPSVDFDAVVGQPARFALHGGLHERFWTGLCNHFEQVRVEPSGLSTYQISLVPTLWLLTQRKNHRMFQQMSEPDIVLKVLKEWDIVPELRIDRGAYKKRKYRVQYDESDFAFISRMLEDAGITFYFEQVGEETKVTLSDAPQTNAKRALPLLFLDEAGTARNHDAGIVTGLRMRQRVRPGKYTLQDHDYRRPPSYKLVSSASGGSGIEDKLERYDYSPGAFLFGTSQGESSPVADDKGKTRTDEKEAVILAQKRLDAKRGSARVCTFETTAHDLAPGVVIRVVGHPHSALGDGRALLIVESSLNGTDQGDWRHHCEARGTEVPFRPEHVTPKPKVNGVESATVVGPKGEEIHTDEFGRVRVHFHWDRESQMDENSSCWIHVSQSWGGAGYGGTNLPRLGQEVLVDFLGGDPDRPVIVGRMYTNLQKTPYSLPGNKTQSGWKSNSTGGGGGYNEVMFEDAQGQELLRMQAEKDLHKLVKNDEQSTVGRDRTRMVKRNESLTIKKNRTKQVVQNERVTIGQNQSITVGVNRSAQIGSSDSTTVGNTYVVMISPPGEAGTSPSSSITLADKKIVLDTGAGATITLDHDKITIEADDIVEIFGKKRGVNIHAPASGGTANVFTGKAFTVTTEKITLTGTDVKIAGTTLSLGGTSTAELTSGGPTTVKGTPVQLNGPGMFAGRVTELAPATITTGAALVLIGGVSFPLPVVKQVEADGSVSLKIGEHLIVKQGTGRYADFQNKVMRDLGVMSSTPAGLQHLNNIENNPGGHNVTIREYTKAEEDVYGKENSLTYPGAGKGDPNALGYDSSGNPVPGSGTDAVIAYNPDIQSGPTGHPEPTDATLFHEMGHADHDVHGINRQWEPAGDGYGNQEEKQTINNGTNMPGSGNNIPGVPKSPSENDYLGDRNYPFRRTDHGSGYSNPDGTPIKH